MEALVAGGVVIALAGFVALGLQRIARRRGRRSRDGDGGPAGVFDTGGDCAGGGGDGGGGDGGGGGD